MQKIMFNDKFGLTQAVLEGRKTMTRRIVPGKLVKAIEDGVPGYAVMESKYKVGEVVAVAQSYDDTGYYPLGTKDEPGWRNKLFVRADLMPHQIRITNVRVERLQDISDEDSIREGIFKLWNPYANSFYYTLPGVFCRQRQEAGCKKTAKEAFAALIDKISGKGTWERNPYVFVYEFEVVK